jgi:branched-chain amino acid transport system substrate-binding protein
MPIAPLIRRISLLFILIGSLVAQAEELVVGSLQDLSGPIAALGAHFKNGTQMRFDEENAKGGVHGRTLKLIAEDTAYDPKKAVLGAEKLIQRDKAFAVINNLGSPVVMATMPMFVDAGVLHLFPAAPLKEVYEPLHPLKFAMSPSYTVSVPPAARHLIGKLGAKRVGILYQDDDMGQEVLRGIDGLLGELKLGWCEKTSYKRGATDFSSQIARLKAANCDFVVLATVVRETIGAYKEARRIGWQVPMLVTASGYTAQVHQLGGTEMEGLYGTVLIPHPYIEGANPTLAAWINRYKQQFSSEPNTWSVMAYAGADLFVRALQQAGPRADAVAVAKALERSNLAPDALGNPAFVLTPTDHLALRRVRVAQIREGRWQIASDFLK